MDEQNFIETIFGREAYMPHGYYFMWQPDLIGLHVVSDLITVLSCYFITAVILLLVRKGGREMSYRWIFLIWAALIFLSGSTQLIDLVTVWYPMYYLQGIVKMMTAAVALCTALLIVPLAPVLREKIRKKDL